jgi:predicted nucleic acid-binding protein
MSPAPVTAAALDLSDGLSVNPTNFVVDAGVAVKWYVPEVHEADAKRFLSPVFTLHIPELFFPEFGNIIWKKARLLKTPEITEAEGRAILELLEGVALTVHPMAQLLKAAFDLAMSAARPTVYDSYYLVLAKTLNCRLVTADQVFYESLNAGPFSPYLLWVTDPT